MLRQEQEFPGDLAHLPFPKALSKANRLNSHSASMPAFLHPEQLPAGAVPAVVTREFLQGLSDQGRLPWVPGLAGLRVWEQRHCTVPELGLRCSPTPTRSTAAGLSCANHLGPGLRQKRDFPTASHSQLFRNHFCSSPLKITAANRAAACHLILSRGSAQMTTFQICLFKIF